MLQEGRDIFVVSDLHLGDKGSRDNFHATYRDNIPREEQLRQFLRYVESVNGQLVVLGDLFELWQSNIGSVLMSRKSILDRLAEMEAIYVVGNHDVDLEPFIGSQMLNHAFFKRMTKSFPYKINGKSYKFMHGHEVDPFNKGNNPGIGRVATIIGGMVEELRGSPLCDDGRLVEEKLLDYVKSGWSGIKCMFIFTFKWGARNQMKKIEKQEALTPRQDPKRAHDTIKYIKDDRKKEGYDIAIVGHTHKPGKCEDWYFNSGSWVCMKEGRAINNFLRISTDGDVKVYDWDNDKAVLNDTVIDPT